MMKTNNPSATRSRLGVTIIFAINGFLYASWVSRLPRLQEQFAVSHAELGTALLAVSIGAIMAMPLTGFVIVRTGSRALTTVAMGPFLVARSVGRYAGRVYECTGCTGRACIGKTRNGLLSCLV